MNSRTRTDRARQGREASSAVFASCAFVCLALSLIVSPLARAEDASSGKGGKRTQINFEDQLVEGQAQKPELFYLLQQRNANFKRLIRLREDFLPEMRKSADEIQRKGTSR